MQQISIIDNHGKLPCHFNILRIFRPIGAFRLHLSVEAFKLDLYDQFQIAWPVGVDVTCRAFLVVLAASLFCCANTSKADPSTSEKSVAESVAADFLRGIDSGDLPSIFNKFAGPTLKSQVQQTDFEQTAGYYRIQFGGPAASRTLVGSQSLSTIPATGQQGIFYYVRYRGAFLNGFIYEDVYLEKEGTDWKVHSMQFFPAPVPQSNSR